MSSHQLDVASWSKLDRFNQLGNIGSEIGRALKAKRAGDEDRTNGAFYRGMDLFNATVDSWAHEKKSGIPELLRAREQFANSILTDIVDEQLEDYFMQYAVAARRRHLK